MDIPAFSPGADRTLEFWINFTSPGDGIVMSFAGDLNNAIDLATYQGGIAYHEWDGANYPGVITTPINDGLWHHIAIVRTSAPADNLTIYVDGVSNVTGTASLNTTTNAFSIGAEHWNGAVIRYLGPGSLDEVRMWNNARTGVEIAGGMHGTVPANSAGLEAYFKFDEAMGTSTADATGNGHNGTLVNEPTRAIPSGAPISAVSSGITGLPLNIGDTQVILETG